jgi:Holliday junction resolvase RusA-like endonuclease
MTVSLVIPGRPVPLQRSRTSSGRHYLPARSKTYRLTVAAEWMAAGRPSLGDAQFAASMRFYGARANADLDNLVKAVLDALNGLAFTDDSQLVCLSGCHKLPADADGPRAEIDLWPAGRLNLERAA